MHVRILITVSSSEYHIATTEWEDDKISLLAPNRDILLGFAEDKPVILKITAVGICINPRYDKPGDTEIEEVRIIATTPDDYRGILRNYLKSQFFVESFASCPASQWLV